jgi:cysteine desulfurase
MSERLPIYCDYAATTPVDPRVAKVMSECLTVEGDFGNPSSVTHVYGRRAALRVARARETVAALVGCDPAEVIFTSGATESDNLAILGVARANADRGRHVVTARTEHKAVIDAARHLEREGFDVTWLVPDAQGIVEPEAVRAALRPDTQLVSIMHVNNEIGVVADIAAIGAVCRERGVIFHTDAAQSAGKLAIDWRELPVDLLSLTAHKLYGPKGVGALIVRETVRPRLAPLLYGGGQERGLRPGTLATHQVAGFGAAAEIAVESRAPDAAYIASLRDRLWERLQALEGLYLNGHPQRRVAGILNVSFEGVEGESLVTALPELAVSTGSACNSAVPDPSYVLRALGRDSQLAQSSIRFSLGRFSTEEEVEAAAAKVVREVRRLRALAP